jgi:hypothetical protein
MQNEWIIFYKFVFLQPDVAFQGMFPTPQTLKPNTCNNCFEANFTKVGFGNGGQLPAYPIHIGFWHECG